MTKKNNPIKKKDEIRDNPDPRINEDFKGYPDGPGKDETIQPRTQNEEKTADVGNKDGEKRIYRKGEIDEQDSDGSANAFEGKE